MKKVLLTLLTLFAVGGVWAQVTETDRSSYLDVIYAESSQVLQGTTDFKLPINIKAHQNFTAVEFVLVLPEDVVVNDLAGLEDSRKRYVKTSGSVVYEYNNLGGGTYKVIATVTCDRGLAPEDGAFSYVSLDVSKLPAGDYSLIVKNATLSGFQNAETGVATGEADAVIADEIVTTLTITDRLVLKETSTEVPSAYENVNVTVKRTIKANEWGTICLPFAMTQKQAFDAFGSDAEFGYFADYEVDGGDGKVSKTQVFDASSITVNFDKEDLSGGFEANIPYLIKTTKDIESFDVDEVKIEPDEESADVEYNNGKSGIKKETYGHFYGTLHAGVSIPENGLFLSGGNFWYSKGLTKMQAFRGYFVLNNVLVDMSSASVKVNVGGESTSINGVGIQQVIEGVYDLSGRKIQLEGNDLNKLQKGVYIIDGKKVTIK